MSLIMTFQTRLLPIRLHITDWNRGGRRPALDALMRDAKRRRFDVLVCGRLDRLGRSLRHLIMFFEELRVPSE
jgi:DNA invertase Pin-like site-specific DNA recombinase